MSGGKPKRVLAVASGGGHWVQLRRMRPAWDGCRVHYVSTLARYASDLEPEERFHVVRDANQWDKLGVAIMALQVMWLVVRVRPHVVVTTGAAPGYFTLRFGRLVGAKTIWIDSIANSEELSLAGRMAARHADVWLTQWPSLAGPAGPQYRGAVL
jgi:UDP-N-acetylglucosamine:LPS N-acetylglucosamine transferase